MVSNESRIKPRRSGRLKSSVQDPVAALVTTVVSGPRGRTGLVLRVQAHAPWVNELVDPRTDEHLYCSRVAADKRDRAKGETSKY
ncbi:hypothetical protein EVAR_97091_1 [Eumeta japonica]|uniref:Uncharacterized protein n=1 Tax=Eumeta variegata TaxID=151549 RepID=A0A4C1X4N5_EUMVA|nr:hypothetical protein EVAR_97091_1 [Eumeta japonica]